MVGRTVQHDTHRLDRHSYLTQLTDRVRASLEGRRVVPVAGLYVDHCRLQQAGLVVEAQRAGREVDGTGEGADREERLGHISKSGPSSHSKVKYQRGQEELPRGGRGTCPVTVKRSASSCRSSQLSVPTAMLQSGLVCNRGWSICA